MVMTRSEATARRIQQLQNRSATTIEINHISTLSGPTPSPNPPTNQNPISSAQYQGDSVITITCQTASGRLVPGDKFTIQGISGTYTVAAQVIAANDTFTNVPIIERFSANIPAGTPIVFDWINQQTILANVPSSYKTQNINGSIVVTLNIKVSILNLSFTPQIGDRCVVNGRTYLIFNIIPVYAWGDPVAYELMVK